MTLGAVKRIASCGALFLALAAIVLMLAPGEAIAQRPALTKNIDEPGRIPYQQFVSAKPAPSSACGLNFCTFVLPVVPAGKRLVVTDLYGTVSLQPTGRVHSLRLEVWDRSVIPWVLRNMYEVPQAPDAYYDVALTFQLERYSFQSKLTMYVDAGSVPQVAFWTGGANLHDDWPTEISVVGYLVDLTQ
jgi:hypothetical protein